MQPLKAENLESGVPSLSPQFPICVTGKVISLPESLHHYCKWKRLDTMINKQITVWGNGHNK